MTASSPIQTAATLQSTRVPVTGVAGQALRVMREAQGLTQRQLAGLAEVEPGYLSQVERGRREPGARWLKAVTDALGRHLAGPTPGL